MQTCINPRIEENNDHTRKILKIRFCRYFKGRKSWGYEVCLTNRYSHGKYF